MESGWPQEVVFNGVETGAPGYGGDGRWTWGCFYGAVTRGEEFGRQFWAANWWIQWAWYLQTTLPTAVTRKHKSRHMLMYYCTLKGTWMTYHCCTTSALREATGDPSLSWPSASRGEPFSCTESMRFLGGSTAFAKNYQMQHTVYSLYPFSLVILWSLYMQ